MRKIFSLLAAMLVALAVNATRTEISPTTPYDADAVRQALYYSGEGDTIVLTEGIYEESNSDYIAFRRSNVLMAKEGDEVIIKPHVPFRVRNGARAEVLGIKIDASEIQSLSTSYENIFEVHDATAGNVWVLKDCEIYGNVAKTVVRCASDKTLDSLIIDGCYIHDNVQATLRMQSTTLQGVIIKNTTIANVANGGSFWCAPIDISNTAADAKIVVDHCTFFHNTTISTSYGDVTVGQDGTQYTSDVTISNCIFAQPEAYEAGRAINLMNGGVVKNCLTFNFTKSTNGIQGETTRTDCITGDPQFVDAENADYTLGDASPALTAGEDGGAIGDPRWWPVPAAPKYAVTIAAGIEHGTVVADKDEAEEGETITVTLTPDAGYDVSSIGVTNVDGNDISQTENAGVVTLTFPMPAADVEISVIFGAIPEPVEYCELPSGHLNNADFGDPSGRILLTIQKVQGTNNIRVTIKNNNANGNTKTGLNFLWVLVAGKETVRYGDGTHAEADVEEVSVEIPFDAAQDSYNFVNIHWAYSGWEGEWAIDGLTVQASELCDNGPATAIDSNAAVEKAVKFIENGQLFIEMNGVRYNATGAMVK